MINLFIQELFGSLFQLFIFLMIPIIYCLSTYLVMRFISYDITLAGSQFSSYGVIALPAVFVYAYIRTGLAEELLFRGFILKTISRKTNFLFR